MEPISYQYKIFEISAEKANNVVGIIAIEVKN